MRKAWKTITIISLTTQTILRTVRTARTTIRTTIRRITRRITRTIRARIATIRTITRTIIRRTTTSKLIRQTNRGALGCLYLHNRNLIVYYSR